MTNEELVHTETYQCFDIRVFFAPEDYDPRGEFQLEDGSDDEDILAKIENGTYMWVQVRVNASKNGIALGNAYLGGGCYSTSDDFFNSGYYEDMRQSAVDEARQVIARLSEV